MSQLIIYSCYKFPDTVDDEGQVFLIFWSRCQRLTRQLVEQHSLLLYNAEYRNRHKHAGCPPLAHQTITAYCRYALPPLLTLMKTQLRVDSRGARLSLVLHA